MIENTFEQNKTNQEVVAVAAENLEGRQEKIVVEDGIKEAIEEVLYTDKEKAFKIKEFLGIPDSVFIPIAKTVIDKNIKYGGEYCKKEAREIINKLELQEEYKDFLDEYFETSLYN